MLPSCRLSPPEVRGILIALLHAADLGNSFKPVHLHAKWSLRVMEEFFGEGRQLQGRVGGVGDKTWGSVALKGSVVCRQAWGTGRAWGISSPHPP